MPAPKIVTKDSVVWVGASVIPTGKLRNDEGGSGPYAYPLAADVDGGN